MLKEQEVSDQLKREIIGQDRAVDAMVRAVMVANLGICDPQRPLGTFLFLGPTGTGKSQIGRSLARILHGNDSGLIVINCTEFKNPHDVSKLTGAPPGYIGHDHPPFLTPERLEKKLTMVIFEELEKADRALNDLLLQVLERGELKTGLGVDLSFRNCFIILTSNVCAKEVDQLTTNSHIGFNPTSLSLDAMDPEMANDRLHSVCLGAVEEFFSPEFINRIDEIVTFNPLRDDHLMLILEKFLAETRLRMASAGIAAVVSDAAKRFLIQKGTNLRYGARPLRRAVREFLEYPLATFIAEEGMPRNQVIHVEAGAERLLFSIARLAAAS